MFSQNISSLLSSASNSNEELLNEWEERIDIIQHKLKYIESKPSVVCIEQLEPIRITYGNIAELISIAGGSAIFTDSIKNPDAVEWDSILLGNPDILLVQLTGHTIEQTIKKIDTLLQLPHFGTLKAVQSNRFYILNDNNQPLNTHPVNYIETLAEIIHPKQFIFGNEGSGWVKFSL